MINDNVHFHCILGLCTFAEMLTAFFQSHRLLLNM